MIRSTIIAVLATVTLAACGSGSDSATGPDPTPSTSAPSEPAFDAASYAAGVEAVFNDANGGRKIDKMCDAAMTHWACHFDHIETPSEKRMIVHLTGGATKDQGLKAATDWFNFVGSDYPDLSTVTAYVDGRDVGTVRRSDLPLLG
ncbi:hypothetical protein [Nocardioides sp.]|uniref:hypothetical protein n=1 Tax=Nocardioides sp. TaxID=35761 RepID=UPI0039E63605